MDKHNNMKLSKSSDTYQERTWNWSRHTMGFHDTDILHHREAKIQTVDH